MKSIGFLLVTSILLGLGLGARPCPAGPVSGKEISLQDLRTAAELKSQEGWLYVVQSEETLEKQIADYIQKKHGLAGSIRAREGEPDDVELSYVAGGNEVPKIRVIVDTAATSRDKTTKKVLERRVSVRGWYVIPAEAKKSKKDLRAKVLELNNRWHREYWIPTFYLDDEDDLWFQVNINIPGEDSPVHAEWVFDTLMRVNTAWRQYYPMLKAVIE